ncbi:MAG TPA: hypothetical protein VIM61_12485 [Chthoniobacterales bacterium]
MRGLPARAAFCSADAMNVRLFLLGLLLVTLAGCAFDEPAPAPTPAQSGHAHVDQAAPVTGGVLFNGN